MSEGVATKEHVRAGAAAAKGRLGAGVVAVEGRASGKIAALRSDLPETAAGIAVTNATSTIARLKLIP